MTRPLRNVFSRQKDRESPKRVQKPYEDQDAPAPTSPFRVNISFISKLKHRFFCNTMKFNTKFKCLLFSKSKQRFGSLRINKKSPIKIDRLRRSFRESLRRRKGQVPDTSNSIQWPIDEQAVRSSTCSFPIKYLGCIEVFERQGLDICEEAMNILKVSITSKIYLKLTIS